MGAEYKVHTKLLTEFETLGVMGENCSGIIKLSIIDSFRGMNMFLHFMISAEQVHSVLRILADISCAHVCCPVGDTSLLGPL